MTKSKAIKSFLQALSHQVPNESLDPLLKPENDALFVLLNSSIEALPMGSAIRKEVDSNMQDYILVFRKELEMRKLEMEENTNVQIDDEEENLLLLKKTNGKIPLIHSELFHLAYKKSNGQDMERFLASDYATEEIIFNHVLKSKGKKKTISSVCDVNAAIQHAFSAGQLTTLDEYIQLFAECMDSQNGSMSNNDVVAEIKSFLKMIVLSKDVLGVPMDTMKAIDLGRIVGKLVTIAILNAEEYSTALKKANQDDDSDGDSSDDESLKVSTKKHMSKAEYMAMKEECARDALLVLCMVYSFTKSLDDSKITSAYLTTGMISALQDMGEKDEHAFKQSTEILIKALDRSHVMDNYELPSAKVIQDATKRCQTLSQWVEKVLKTASLQSQAASEEIEPNSSPIFVMDTVANDVSIESDSDEDEDSNKSESEHGSDSDSDEDEEPMFVLDTEKSDIGLEVSDKDDALSAKDEEKGDEEDDDDSDDEDHGNDRDGDQSEVESDRSEIGETKSSKPPLNKKSKAVLQAVPEDEEVDTTPSKTTKSQTIHATPSRRTRSNSNMSNLSTDTPTRVTRSRARGMSTSSVDTFGQESVASSASKTTPRSTRKRSASGASETPVGTRRSSRRLK